MRNFAFPAILHPEKGGAITVRFAGLSEAITFGTGLEDALVQAAGCLEEAIAGRIAGGLEIPAPSRAKRSHTMVTLPASMAANASLCLAMREAGISRAQLARRLRVDVKEVRRMLDPRHPTKLPRIEQALAVLGRRLVVSLDSAA